MMRERPILFSAPMVRAILDGHKTVTRRVAKLNYAGRVALRGRQWHVDDPNAFLACPYGVPGDRLWVREAWAVPHKYDGIPPRLLPVDARVHFSATEDRGGLLWRPSVNMPRWASRITLEIVGVRVERLQEISHDDAVSGGMSAGVWRRADGLHRRTPLGSNAVKRFAILWDELNFARGYGWDANPWVWRIEFRRIANAERAG